MRQRPWDYADLRQGFTSPDEINETVARARLAELDLIESGYVLFWSGGSVIPTGVFVCEFVCVRLYPLVALIAAAMPEAFKIGNERFAILWYSFD